MDLYSYKGKEPEPLPKRIRLDNGVTKTSLGELTSQELLDLGFVGPITKPEIDPNLSKISTREWTGSEYQITTGPKPFSSWVASNGEWEAPVAYPTDGKVYNWNEDSGSWTAI